MSSFDKIKSIKSIDELKNVKINENKDCIILFFYWNSCGACHRTIPIVSEIFENLSRENNCVIVKVHIEDIKDNSLKNMSNDGVPAFKLLKKINNEYILDRLNDDSKFTTVGLSMVDHFDKEKNKNILSTKNTLLYWINHSGNKLTEGFQIDNTQDDGSGYTFMKNYNRKSFNKIINDNIKKN